MTVAVGDDRSGPWNADGSNRTWTFNFKVLDASHLVLEVTDLSGAITVVGSAGFAATGIGSENGGTVTYPLSPAAPLPTGYKVEPVRSVPFGQPYRIGNQGGFHAATHEAALDFLAMQIAQLNFEGPLRVVKAPRVDGTIDMTLPAKAARLGKVLSFNSVTGRPEATASQTELLQASTAAVNAAAVAVPAAATAVNAKTDAEAALHDYRTRFYGAFADDPATDPFGNPSVIGALYLNTTTGRLRVYRGSLPWYEEPSSQAFLRVETYSAAKGNLNAGQTVFTVAGGVIPGPANWLTYNGFTLTPGVDVTFTASGFTLAVAAAADAELTFYGFGSFNVANVLSPVNNLSDVPNKAAARVNLGAAPVASPAFTGPWTATGSLSFTTAGTGVVFYGSTGANGGAIRDLSGTGTIHLGHNNRHVFYNQAGTVELLDLDAAKTAPLWKGTSVVWHSDNFTPSSKANLSGGNTWSGTQTFGTLPGLSAIVNIGSVTGALALGASDTGGTGAALSTNRSGSNGWQIGFYQGGGSVGSISTTGTTTTYATSSDVRLKDDFQEVDGLAMVRAINVYDFRWKADRSRSIGCVAQELYQVEPRAVDVGQTIATVEDAIEEYTTKTGRKRKRKAKRTRIEERPWSVDYSKLVPHLIRAVQQLETRIAELEARP